MKKLTLKKSIISNLSEIDNMNMVKGGKDGYTNEATIGGYQCKSSVLFYTCNDGDNCNIPV